MKYFDFHVIGQYTSRDWICMAQLKTIGKYPSDNPQLSKYSDCCEKYLKIINTIAPIGFKKCTHAQDLFFVYFRTK